MSSVVNNRWREMNVIRRNETKQNGEQETERELGNEKERNAHGKKRMKNGKKKENKTKRND